MQAGGLRYNAIIVSGVGCSTVKNVTHITFLCYSFLYPSRGQHKQMYIFETRRTLWRAPWVPMRSGPTPRRWMTGEQV